MARPKSTEQLNVRVPEFVRDELRQLHADLEQKDGRDTSEPVLVAALIHAATRASALAALTKYAKRMSTGE